MGLEGLLRSSALVRGVCGALAKRRPTPVLGATYSLNSIPPSIFIRPVRHYSFPFLGQAAEKSEGKEPEKKPEVSGKDKEAAQKELVEKLKEWNKQEEFAYVIKKVESHPHLANSEVVAEYIKALTARHKAGEPELSSLVSKLLQEPGRHANNPIYISRAPKSLWERLLYPILFAIFLIYLLRGGPFGGFSSRPNEYQAIGPKVGFRNVKGNEEAKEEMADLVEYLKDPKKFVDLGVKMPKGVLLMGPPGTGKTLMARALAGEAGVPFFYASGSEFEEMLVGVGAMRIRNLFNHARMHAPCIIFIDEIDAIGLRRDDQKSNTKMTLNQLLVELDGFSTSQGVIVVAATNLPDVLDPALIRPGRFDRQVHLELPDKKAREEILEMYLSEKKGPDVDLKVISRHTSGLSGADLFNVANWAAIEAIKRGENKVTQAMLENSLENAVLGRQRKSLIVSESTKKLTSFHEAGHAIVALYTPGASPIHKATLVPRGHALGMVQQLGNDDLMYTRQELLAGLDVAMGGRAAEELIFGSSKVTQGAGSDFQQATRKAKAMVTHLGMSDKIGKVYLDKKEGDISPETQNLIDSEVRNLLEESFSRAHSLLASHKAELHRLSDALLEYETLSLDEIKLVIAGKTLPPRPVPAPPPQPKPLPQPTTLPTPTHAPAANPLPHFPPHPQPTPSIPAPTPSPIPNFPPPWMNPPPTSKTDAQDPTTTNYTSSPDTSLQFSAHPATPTNYTSSPQFSHNLAPTQHDTTTSTQTITNTSTPMPPTYT